MAVAASVHTVVVAAGAYRVITSFQVAGKAASTCLAVGTLAAGTQIASLVAATSSSVADKPLARTPIATRLATASPTATSSSIVT